MEEGEKDWRTLLPDVVKALNEAPSDALLGKSPDAIDEVAVFDLQQVNAEKAVKSQQKQVDHKKKIAESGKVRVQIETSKKQEEEDEKKNRKKFFRKKRNVYEKY